MKRMSYISAWLYLSAIMFLCAYMTAFVLGHLLGALFTVALIAIVSMFTNDLTIG